MQRSPVRPRMLMLQHGGDARRADERQHIDVAALHQRPDDHAAFAVHRVDDAWRKGGRKGVEQRRVQQHAVPGRLENDGVAHQQRRNQRGEGLVEGVVVGPHAQHHAQRTAADLRDEPLLDGEARRGAVELLERLHGVPDVLHRPVEFLPRIGQRFPDLPHQQPHHFVADGDHARDEALESANAFGHRHARPRPGAMVIRRLRRGERRARGVRRHERVMAQRVRLQPRGAADAHGREHFLARTVPFADLAVDQVARAGVVVRNAHIRRDLVHTGGKDGGGSIDAGGHWQHSGMVDAERSEVRPVPA